MAAVNKVSAPHGSRVSLEGMADEALPNHMNSFFTRFETHDFSSHISNVKQSLMPDDSAVIDQERVLGLFKHIGIRCKQMPRSRWDLWQNSQILCRAA